MREQGCAIGVVRVAEADEGDNRRCWREDGPETCGDQIISIDSEADFDGSLCCYDVTHSDDSSCGVATPIVG